MCLAICATASGAQTADTTRRDSTQSVRLRPDSLAKNSLKARRASAAANDSLAAQRDSVEVKTDLTTVTDWFVTVTNSAMADAEWFATTVTKNSATVTESTSAASPPIHVTMPPFRAAKDSLALVRTIRAGLTNPGWPVKGPPVAAGSILPAKRIVAFYGSTVSKRMGILGQIPPDSMLAKLEGVAAEWQAADSTTRVQKALHLVTVVAAADAGKDGRYRYRMDSTVIERVYGWAKRADAILFLDIQAGRSSVMDELPHLARFLERPEVHLGIDPEFNMRPLRDTLVRPGKQIGILTAKEINFAIDFLAKIVDARKLPPKVLIIHRFRRDMVKDANEIKLDPRVQIVMHMDGWGVPAIKYSSYQQFIVNEPVQFTGFKLFYRHDTQFGDKLLTPMELVQLRPAPLYIQYQ
jgi:hypothetical protein